MQYGFFDDKHKEYVITRPDTPSPWANYLGSPEYGAIITNHAGGYSFVKSGANGRFLRYVFNAFDEPGRYIYIRDNKSGDYWSASWQPVGKKLEDYSCETRHGTGYSRFLADYSGIHSEAIYYVPHNKTYEVWHIRITNTSETPRSLTVSGFAEFTNENNYEQDQVNLQYSQFITSTQFRTNRIRDLVMGNLEGVSGREHSERFFGLAGAKVSSFCGSKEDFIGPYRRYSNPIGIEKGHLGNTLCYCGTAIGALSTVIELQPSTMCEFAFIAGMKSDDEANLLVKRYDSDILICNEEEKELIDYWHGKLERLYVKSPSKEFNSMINAWHPYNCFITFIWSRAASLIYCGQRNGYGYRDTVQDIQGIIHLDHEMAAEKLRFMISGQVDNGAGLPLVKFTHNPGSEDTPDDESYRKETGHPAYRADDAMWLFPTIYKYIAESGNIDFLDEEIPYANKGKDTVYNHLKQAISFTELHLGNNGMPAGLHADWNDCLRLGKLGESSFVAFQYLYALNLMRIFAVEKNDSEYIKYIDLKQETMSNIILDTCWDKDRFIRGITEDGSKIGPRNSIEANMWLNPQSWAVISEICNKDRAGEMMRLVRDRLSTPFGAILMDPPFQHQAFEGALSVIYNAGTKENASVFQQTQGWLILAEALLGNGNRAFQYYMSCCPAAQNSIADIRVMEPYVYGQFTEGKHSPNMGCSHVHWLTGTASTVMVSCVEGILGLKPDLHGIRISPSIPSTWEELSVDKVFRSSMLHIKVHNPGHAENGFKKMILNGNIIDDNYISCCDMKEENYIDLYIS